VKFNYDEWEQPKEPRDAYERIVRPADRGTRQEDEARYSRRGIPMRDCEYADFVTRGGKIDLGERRFEWQRHNDRRYEKNKKRHPLTETVLHCLAQWNSSEYLEKHRRTVRDLLEKPRNQRRRQLSDISTKLRRHQQALRLIHAISFEGLTAAEYCQQHGLDPADASRMLDHLYEKEPGLADAIGAISACGTATSWQNRQENRRRRYKEGREKSAILVFGTDYSNVADRGEWLADTSAGSRRSYTTGAAASISDIGAIPKYIRNDPIRPETGHAPAKPPFDLHEPVTWYASDYLSIPRKQRLFLHYWNAFYNSMRTVKRLEPRLDRYRETKRTLKYKASGHKKSKIVARILDGTASPLRVDYLVEARRDYLLWVNRVRPDLPEPHLPLLPPHGIFHRRFRPETPIHIVLEIRDLPSRRTTKDNWWNTGVDGGGAVFVHHGYPTEPGLYVAPPSLEIAWGRIEERLRASKWSKGSMCVPTRSGQILTAVHRGILPDIELRWANYCRDVPSRRAIWIAAPAHVDDPRDRSECKLQPFTRLGAICWIGPLRRATAKDYADFLPATSQRAPRLPQQPQETSNE
jgi:hypothetical protein